MKFINSEQDRVQLLCLRDRPCLTPPEVPVPPSSGPAPRSLCLLGMSRSGGSDPHVPRLQRTGPWSLSRRLQPAPRSSTCFLSVGVRMFASRCLVGQACEHVAWGPLCGKARHSATLGGIPDGTRPPRSGSPDGASRGPRGTAAAGSPLRPWGPRRQPGWRGLVLNPETRETGRFSQVFSFRRKRGRGSEESRVSMSERSAL